MNWVDLVVLGVVGLSGVLAFIRGLLREVMGVGAWIVAYYVAWRYYPVLEPKFTEWLSDPDMVEPAAIGMMFVATLIVLSVVANMLDGMARGPALGGINRTLGMVFGLARGAALVVFAYILAGIVVDVGNWPDPVIQARSLPLAYAGAVWAVGRLPEKYRPKVDPPPAGCETRAADVLHDIPAGRAIDRN